MRSEASAGHDDDRPVNEDIEITVWPRLADLMGDHREAVEHRQRVLAEYDEVLNTFMDSDPTFRRLSELSQNHEDHHRKERPQNEPGE